jgi:hypothetical protein
MLLWALMASGQITMRKIDGWQTLSQPIEPGESGEFFIAR